MFKAKALNQGMIGFDQRMPVYALTAGSSGTLMRLSLGLTIDPIMAVKQEAHELHIQVLSSSPALPSVLDDVQHRGDIIENIKSIDSELKTVYNDFVDSNVVLAQETVSVSSILSLIPGLAYEYAESNGELESVSNALPFVDVALSTKRIKKNQQNAASKVSIDRTFSYPELDGFFDRSDLPISLSPDLMALQAFYADSFKNKKPVSSVMYYPFPINEQMEQYRDVLSSVGSSNAQVANSTFLGSEDFINYSNVGQPIGSIPADTLGATTAALNNTAVADISFSQDADVLTTDPLSSLASVYQTLIAYNESGVDDVSVLRKQLKILPFKRTFTFETENIISNNLHIKITIRKKTGAIVDTLNKNINTTTILHDTSRPKVAPLVESVFLESDEGSSVVIKALQQDAVSSKIMLLIKPGRGKRFEKIGTFSCVYQQEVERQFAGPLMDDTSVIIRAIALSGGSKFSNAFTDIVVSTSPVILDTAGDGEQPSPDDAQSQTTKGIRIAAREASLVSDTFGIDIITGITQDAGLRAAPSRYSGLTLRRLSDTESIDDITAGENVKEIPGGDIDQLVPPGEKFTDSVSSGLYVYVADGHTSDGITDYNVANTSISVGLDDLVKNGSSTGAEQIGQSQSIPYVMSIHDVTQRVENSSISWSVGVTFAPEIPDNFTLDPNFVNLVVTLGDLEELQIDRTLSAARGGFTFNKDADISGYRFETGLLPLTNFTAQQQVLLLDTSPDLIQLTLLQQGFGIEAGGLTPGVSPDPLDSGVLDPVATPTADGLLGGLR